MLILQTVANKRKHHHFTKRGGWAGDRHHVENTIISLREVVGQVTDTMWKTPSFH
jgi:hypothetical protein